MNENKKKIMKKFLELILKKNLLTKFLNDIFEYNSFKDNNYIYRLCSDEESIVIDIYMITLVLIDLIDIYIVLCVIMIMIIW